MRLIDRSPSRLTDSLISLILPVTVASALFPGYLVLQAVFWHDISTTHRGSALTHNEHDSDPPAKWGGYLRASSVCP